MKILAIDTSSKNASVAILEDMTTLVELNNKDEKTHSQKLMPMIDEALKQTSLSLNDIQLIACSLGPGSFTGVRIGIATAKAFVDSSHACAVGVSSLEGLAYNLNKEGFVCSLLDAGHGNVYAGLFKITKKENSSYLQVISSNLSFLNLQDSLGNITASSLTDFIDNNVDVKVDGFPLYFVGDGALLYKDILQNLSFAKKQNVFISSEEESTVSSISIAKIGYIKYKNGNYGDSSVLSPIYLRKSQAELALEKK